MKEIKYIIFMSCSGSGTVINYGYGSGSDFLTSYGSGSTSQKVTVPTVPVPVPQHCSKQLSCKIMWLLFLLFYKQFYFLFLRYQSPGWNKSTFFIFAKMWNLYNFFYFEEISRTSIFTSFRGNKLNIFISQHFRENDLTFCVFVKNFAKIIQSLAAANLF